MAKVFTQSWTGNITFLKVPDADKKGWIFSMRKNFKNTIVNQNPFTIGFMIGKNIDYNENTRMWGFTHKPNFSKEGTNYIIFSCKSKTYITRFRSCIKNDKLQKNIWSRGNHNFNHLVVVDIEKILDISAHDFLASLGLSVSALKHQQCNINGDKATVFINKYID